MSTSFIAISNELKIVQYWNEFNKSGQSYTLGICYQPIYLQSLKRFDIEDQVEHFKKTMYCNSKNDRNDLQRNVVLVFWHTDIKFILLNIKSICENTSFSLSHLKLLKWMKEQDCDNYKKFKTHLYRMLNIKIKDTCNTMTIKEFITSLIYHYLNDNLIL